MNGRGLNASQPRIWPFSRVLARVLKIEIRVFPSVFECSRVLNMAIDAHEII
jgi:hypothetical protein